MANKKLRFVALIAVALVLVCMLVACTTTTTKANYNVIIHLGDGQSDITWDRQADFPTLSREHYLEEGLYLDAEFKTATTREDLKAMWLTGDIDVYVNWTKIIYKITVHPANGEQDVIWEPAPGNKIPAFTKVGYIMDGFYFDENCTQSADSVFAEELLENKEVWVKWNECDHKAVTEWTEDKKASCTEAGHKIATCPTCAKELEDTITALGHNSDGVVTHKDANCTEDGVVGGTYCTRCGLGRVDAETVIPALGHKYGETTIAWNDDYTAFIATRTCSNCTDGVDGHTQTATSTWHGIYVTTTQPTCTEAGVADYIVVFDVDWIKGDQWISAIQPAEGHNYTKVNHDDTHHWKECSVCGDVDESSKGTHTYNQTVAIDEYLATSATCQAKATYYKSCECGAHGTETFESGDALGHDYGETSYSWNDDYTVCTATHACKRVGCTDEVEGHTETATAIQIDSNVTQVQTCENPELTTYTAMFGVAWAETQTKADIHTKDALGHNTSQICKDENNHWYACVNDGCTYTTQEVAHAWDEGKQTKEPTETEQGEKTFTCTLCWQTKIEYTGFASHKHEFDTTKWSHDTEYHWHPTTCGHTVKDNTSGYEKHVYGDVTYTWSSDNTKCTAVHSCKCGYSESEEATITTSVTEATCTTAEYTTYTATFKNTAFAEQTKANNKTGEANGHHYGAVTYALDDYYTITNNEYTFIATRTCSNCAEGVEGHTQTATSVDWDSYNVITEPTCTEKGEANYYVTFNVDWIDGKQIVSGWMSKSGHKYTVINHDDTHHWKECSVCGDVDESSKGTHTYDQNVVHKDYLATPATCIATAKYYKTCECGAMGTETFDDSHYAKHTFSEDAWQNEVPATCTSTGIVAHKDCSVCGKHCDNEGNVIADDNYTIAKDEDAHKYGEWTSNGDGTHSRVCEYNAEHKETGNCSGGTATCTEKAECTVCHEEYGVLGNHTFGTWVDEDPATCVSTGTVAHKDCSVCKKHFDTDGVEISAEDYTIAINESNHTFGDLIAAVEAGVSTPAIAGHYQCTACNKYFDADKVEVEYSTLITVDQTATYTVIASYSGASGNMNGEVNNATTIGLNDEIFNVISSLYNDYTTHVGLNKDGTIRLYQQGSGNKYCDLKISLSEGFTSQGFVIESIQVELGDGKNSGVLTVKDGTNIVTGSNNLYKINGSTVVLYNGNTANSQVWIKSITIKYGILSDEKQAQAKANEIANGLTLDDIKFANVGDEYTTLPTIGADDATIAWEVVEENSNIKYDSAENILKVLAKPTDSDAQYSLKATVSVTVNSVSKTATKTFDKIVTVYADTVIKHKVTITENSLADIAITADGQPINNNDEVADGTTITITVTAKTSNNGTYTFVVKNGTAPLECTNNTYSVTVNADVAISVDATPVLDTPEQIVGAAYDLEVGGTLGTQTLEGKVTSIDTPYDTQYKNITVIIQIGDLTGKKIQCFRLKGTGAEYIAVDDTIKVTGTLKNYNGTIEFDSGSTFVYTSKSTVTVSMAEDIKATVTIDGESAQSNYEVIKGSDFTISIALDTGYKATITSDKDDSSTLTASGDCKLTIKGNTTITIATSAIEDGGSTGGEGGTDTPSTDPVTDTITISDMGWTNGTQYNSITKDAYTITASGGANTGKCYNNGKEWRIYQNENPSLKFEAKAGYTIVSVKITYTYSNSGVLTKDGSNITSGTLVEVNASSVTFGVGNTGSVTNGQVKITAIEVVYKASSSTEGGTSGDTEGGTTGGEGETTTSTITISASNATVKDVAGNTITSPATVNNGEFKFTVTPADGYKVDSVTAGGTTLTATEGVYTINVTADTTIEIKTAKKENNTSVIVKMADYAKAKNWSNGTAYDEIKADDNITITCSGTGNTGKYYTSNTSWRIYQSGGGAITISAAQGTIVSIKVTYKSGSSGKMTQNSTVIDSNESVSVNATSATFGVNTGNIQITQIEVVYKAVEA